MVLEGLDEWVAGAQPGEQRSVAAERIRECAADRATVLDVSGLGLTALPDSVGRLASLQYLECQDNLLEALPDSIGQLTALQRLWCDNNPLAALPDSIWQLTALQRLYCDNNQLTALPDTIGRLAQLQVLWCSDNQLAALPDWLLHRPVPSGTYAGVIGRVQHTLTQV